MLARVHAMTRSLQGLGVDAMFGITVGVRRMSSPRPQIERDPLFGRVSESMRIPNLCPDDQCR